MKRVLHPFYSHFVLFCFLLSQLATPVWQHLQAAEPHSDVPAKREAGPETRLETPSGIPQHVNLTETEDVHALAKELLALNAKAKSEGKELVFRFFHFKGNAPDPKLATLISLLAKEHVSLGGHVFTQEQFDEMLKAGSAELPSENALQSYALNFDASTSTSSSSSSRLRRLAGYLSPYHLIKRLNAFKNLLFGLPNGITGITFWEHFYKKNEKNEWVWRFKPDWQMFRFALGTAIWGVANLSLVRYFGPQLFGTEPLEFSSAFWAINGVVLAWVFSFLFLSREVASFKQQGINVRFDETAPDGKQLVIDPNGKFFTGSSIVQEWVLKGMILSTAASLGASITSDNIWGAVENGILAAYAYIAPEDLRCKLLLKSEKLRFTDPDQSRKLRIQANMLGWVFWNLIFSTCINLHFFIPGFWARVPFLVLGTVGFTWKILSSPARSQNTSLWRRFKNLFSTRSQPAKPEELRACSDILVVTEHH